MGSCTCMECRGIGWMDGLGSLGERVGAGDTAMACQRGKRASNDTNLDSHCMQM